MKKSIVVLLSMLLLACSNTEHEDLRQWMSETSKGIKGKIPELPQVKPYEAVPHDVGNLLDPFKPGKIGPDQKKGGGGGLQPDLDRPREPLEAYPLESLKYVGVMTRKGTSFAIVLVDGALYQVRAGNYMGQNFGVITQISESELKLKELVQDPAGDWTERESVLMLQGQEGKK